MKSPTAEARGARKRFPLERAPLFTAIFCNDSVAALSRQARAAHRAGADAICAELRNLKREDRAPARLRALMDASPLPTMCCLYRSDVLDGADDDARTKTLLGRAAAPSEVVDFILYLASEKGSFVTGTNHVVDGGRLCIPR